MLRVKYYLMEKAYSKWGGMNFREKMVSKLTYDFEVIEIKTMEFFITLSNNLIFSLRLRT